MLMSFVASSIAFEARRALDSDGELARFIRDAGHSRLATPETLASLYDVLGVETVDDLELLADDEEYAGLGIRSDEAHALQLAARVEVLRRPLAEDFGVAGAAAVASTMYSMGYTDLGMMKELELNEALKAGLTEEQWRTVTTTRISCTGTRCRPAAKDEL